MNTVIVVSSLQCYSCVYVEKLSQLDSPSDKKCDDPPQLRISIGCKNGGCFVSVHM